jgi:hypothetical protein
MKKGFSAGLLAVALVAGVARADVYEWRDADGARHFTNSLQGVPSAYQSAAIVVVADWIHPAEPASAAAAASAPPAPAPAQAEVVTDSAAWNEAYVAGMHAAMGLGSGGGEGGSVQINGPLAVASTRQSGADIPGFYPPWPWYYPLVTTGFDRGRSRHMTLRMLLQDQFALDREGPYAYERWDQPGLGPALAPFLSRGLPYGVSQYGRVIYR